MWEQIEICKKELEEEYKKNNELINRISNLRLILFLLAFVFTIIGWNSENISNTFTIEKNSSFEAAVFTPATTQKDRFENTRVVMFSFLLNKVGA